MKKIIFAAASALLVTLALCACGSQKCNMCGKSCSSAHSYRDGKVVLCGACYKDCFKEKTEVKYDESVIRALAATDDDKKNKDDDKAQDDDTDPLVMECVELALDAGQVSASMIQRKYRVGYARAGRILDQMEKKGFISGFDGSKPRKVIITREQFYAMVGAEGEEELFDDPDEE